MFNSFYRVYLLISFVRPFFTFLLTPPVCHQILISCLSNHKEDSADDDYVEINPTSQLLPNSSCKERDLQNGQKLRFTAYRAAWTKCLNKIKVRKYPASMLCNLSTSAGSYRRTTRSICQVRRERDQVCVP